MTINVALLVTIWCHLGYAGLPGIPCIGFPTVAAVQGDRLNGADVASIFLTGCQYQCQEPAPKIDCSCRRTKYHVPDSWVDKRQIHLDPTISDYSEFYRDKRVKDANGSPGSDESAKQGLEPSQIIFYAGEGTPESFAAIGGEQQVNLGDFSLGDVHTRYVFMTSCNVLAHGPRAQDGDFGDPNSFEASQFRPLQSLAGNKPVTADAFYRWGRDYGDGRRPLNPSLRLACGGSSAIGGAGEYGGYPTHLFWYYLSVRRLNPADSWLLGLYVHDRAEPLCMSRGDGLKASGLGDPWFQRTPLAAGAALPKFVYIEYPVEGRQGDPLVQAASKEIPAKATAPPQPLAEAASLPVLQLTATSVPPVFNLEPAGGTALSYGFLGGPANLVAHGLLPILFPNSPINDSVAVHAEDVCVEKNPASGSVAISWRPNAIVDNPNTAHDLDAAANDFLLRLLKLFHDSDHAGPADGKKAFVQGVTAIQMKIDTVAAADLLMQPAGLDGCLYLRQTRALDLGLPSPIAIFGEGSETLIGRCPANGIRWESPASRAPANPCERVGSPLATFAYTNRGIMTEDVGQAKGAKLRLEDAVIQEARSMLGVATDKADRYKALRPRLGYRAAPVHCVQGQMYLVYQVDFISELVNKSRIRGVNGRGRWQQRTSVNPS